MVKDSISLARTWINAVLTGSWPDVSRRDFGVAQFRVILLIIIIIITFFFFFLHRLGRLTCSGIDALPSFPRASTISSYHLIRRYPRLCVFAYEYFIFLRRVTSPSAKPPFLEDLISLFGKIFESVKPALTL